MLKKQLFVVMVFVLFVNSIQAKSLYVKKDTTIAGENAVLKIDKKTGAVKRIYGIKKFSDKNLSKTNIKETSQAFIDSHSKMFRITSKDLKLIQCEKVQNRWLVRYNQLYKGIPVNGAFLGFTITENGGIVNIGSNIHPNLKINTKFSLKNNQALETTILKFNMLTKNNNYTVRKSPELKILPIEKENQYDYYITYHIELELIDSLNVYSQSYFVNANNGEIILDYSNIKKDHDLNLTIRTSYWPKHYYDNVQYDGYCFNNSSSKLYNTLGQLVDSKDTNSSGFVSYTVPTYAMYFLKIYLEHPYCNIIDDDNNQVRGLFSQGFTPGTYNNVSVIPSDGSNVYHHVNIIHDHFKSAPYNYSAMDYQMTAVLFDDLNINGISYGNLIGFGTQGGYHWARSSDVIYHEYTHCVVYHLYGNHWIDPSQSDIMKMAMDEAFPDYYACTINDDPIQGESCGVSRNLDNELIFNELVGYYENSQVLSGACWNLQKSSVGLNTTNQLVFEALQNIPHAYSFEEFAETLVFAADDDADLSTGVPYYKEIEKAFEEDHGIEIDIPGLLSGTISNNQTWYDGYFIADDLIIGSNVTIVIADNATIGFDPGANLIINGTLNTQNVTFNGSQGAHITVNSNNNTIDGSVTFASGSVIQFGTNAGLSINGQVNASDVTFSSPANSLSLLEFNSSFTANSSTNITFSPGLLVSFNQDVTLLDGASLYLNSICTGFYGTTQFNLGSTCTIGDSTNVTFFQTFNNFSENLIFGKNSHVDFDGLTNLKSGSQCTFGENSNIDFNGSTTISTGAQLTVGDNSYADFNEFTYFNTGAQCNFGVSSDVEFKENFLCYGVFHLGDNSIITYYKNACFDSNSDYYAGQNSTEIYKGVTIHDGDSEFRSGSVVTFEDSVYFGGGANSTFRSDVIVTYHKPCFIDSGSVVNYTHDVTALHKSDFKVYGKFWADNSILDFGDDSTTAPGVVFEGEGATLSRITDSMIKDGVDGFTITNASPLIKTSEVRSVVKRGFNISGIDAEPEIRECYVHTCGTYPVQVLYEADPVVVDSRLYGGSKTAARIWGADGEYSRNEFRSNGGSGAFTFSSSANPQFFSYADSGGNMFDMANIGAHGVFIGGGYPLFGDSPNILGNNTIKNRGSQYYIYNDTPGTILAELNWWPDGTSSSTFYNADGGSIDTSPKLDDEPFSGPLLKTAISPYATGFEKFRKKDYENAMTELKEALKQDKKSYRADKAVFQLAKSARKIGRLGELEPLLLELQKESNPQIQYHSRNWLCYLYASRNNMSKAEKLATELSAGSSLERTLLLDICSYYAAWKDTVNAVRIADILKSRHSDDVLDMELEAALEGYVDFQQVRGKTKIKRPIINPAMEPEPEPETEVAVADTVQFKTGIYPNPFNASTTVHYNLKDEGHVSIVVYDLLGRKVKTLVDENRSTGAHRVIWDGRDESGMPASSGIYFVRIQSRDAARTFKISYLK